MRLNSVTNQSDVDRAENNAPAQRHPAVQEGNTDSANDPQPKYGEFPVFCSDVKLPHLHTTSENIVIPQSYVDPLNYLADCESKCVTALFKLVQHSINILNK